MRNYFSIAHASIEMVKFSNSACRVIIKYKIDDARILFYINLLSIKENNFSTFFLSEGDNFSTFNQAYCFIVSQKDFISRNFSTYHSLYTLHISFLYLPIPKYYKRHTYV